LDLRIRENPKLKMGAGVGEAHRRIREIIPLQLADALWGPEIEEVRKLVSEGLLVL
jgi:hypothetical protein